MGGAHNNWGDMAKTLKLTLVNELENLHGLDASTIKDQRYNKFRSFGKFKDPATKKA